MVWNSAFYLRNDKVHEVAIHTLDPFTYLRTRGKCNLRCHQCLLGILEEALH